MDKSRFYLVLVAALLSSPGAAYELQWDGLPPVPRQQSAQACTLAVIAAASDCPLRSGSTWQLEWASRTPGISLTLLPEPFTSGSGEPLEYRFGEGLPGLGGQVDTLLQTVAPNQCPGVVARFRLELPPNPEAAVILVVHDPTSTPRIRVVATLPIGDNPPLSPPVVIDGSGVDSSFSSRVALEGVGLDLVREGYWVDSSRRDTVRAVVCSTTRDRANLQFTRRFRKTRGSLILLLDNLGRGVPFPATALAWTDVTYPVPRNPVVRFQPHTVDLPPGVSSATLDELTFYRVGVKDALQAASVRSVKRLFPSASHPSSEFSTNLLGEPILADDLADIYTAVLDSSANTHAAVAGLLASPWVQYADASPNTAAFFTADPYWPQQWNLNNGGASICGYPAQSAIDVGVLGAWPLTQGALATRVAVIDDGVLANHPDLPPYLVVGPYFTPEPGIHGISHGTAVIGIISAVPNNGEGLAGIAPGVTPISIQLDLIADYMAQSIQYCTSQNIPIVNMSWGSPSIYPQVRDACRSAFEAGQLLVAASGNNDDAVPSYPAAYQRFVTAVTAVLPDGRPWRELFVTGVPGGEGNSIGPHVDFTAPAGTYVVTTGATPLGPYYWSQDECTPGEEDGFGHTSAAAPTVSGIAGLLHSYVSSVLNYRLLGEDLQGILRFSAVDITLSPAQLGKDDYTGWGMPRQTKPWHSSPHRAASPRKPSVISAELELSLSQ